MYAYSQGLGDEVRVNLSAPPLQTTCHLPHVTPVCCELMSLALCDVLCIERLETQHGHWGPEDAGQSVVGSRSFMMALWGAQWIMIDHDAMLVR